MVLCATMEQFGAAAEEEITSKGQKMAWDSELIDIIDKSHAIQVVRAYNFPELLIFSFIILIRIDKCDFMKRTPVNVTTVHSALCRRVSEKDMTAKHDD
jgi:hypothetical protein